MRFSAYFYRVISASFNKEEKNYRICVCCQSESKMIGTWFFSALLLESRGDWVFIRGGGGVGGAKRGIRGLFHINLYKKLKKLFFFVNFQRAGHLNKHETINRNMFKFRIARSILWLLRFLPLHSRLFFGEKIETRKKVKKMVNEA